MRVNGRTYVPVSSVGYFLGFLLSVLFSIGWTEEGDPTMALVWIAIAAILAACFLTDDYA